eukprot:1369655-Prymnesium_polylepis.1
MYVGAVEIYETFRPGAVARVSVRPPPTRTLALAGAHVARVPRAAAARRDPHCSPPRPEASAAQRRLQHRRVCSTDASAAQT